MSEHWTDQTMTLSVEAPIPKREDVIAWLERNGWKHHGSYKECTYYINAQGIMTRVPVYELEEARWIGPLMTQELKKIALCHGSSSLQIWNEMVPGKDAE